MERHMSMMYSSLVSKKIDISRLAINRKSNFIHLKERKETKLVFGPISQIIYQNTVFFLETI